MMDEVSGEKPGNSWSDEGIKSKREAIKGACRDRNILGLVNLASSSGGLLEDGLREAAWPLLLNYASTQPADAEPEDSWRSLPAHGDEEQVQRDVDRAFVYYPNNESQKTIEANKIKLFNLITRVLRTHPMLCYFQGYHDIVQVLLLVLGEHAAFTAVSRLSLFRIRDYMLPTLTPAIKHLQLIPAILELADPELARRLSETRPFFALSATLTLYAHDIQEYSDIARIYDFVLAHEPVMTIYLFAAIVLSRREELLEIPVDEPEMLHFTLSKLPQPLDIEGFISASLQLFKNYPPHILPRRVWSRISSSSVLKTSRDILAKQDDQKAQALFRAQARELKREEFIQKSLKQVARNKRPLLSVAGACLVGATSIWLRRTGYDRVILVSIWRMYNIISNST